MRILVGVLVGILLMMWCLVAALVPPGGENNTYINTFITLRHQYLYYERVSVLMDVIQKITPRAKRISLLY